MTDNKLPINITDDVYDESTALKNFARENADREEIELESVQQEHDEVVAQSKEVFGSE